jgi:DNA-binding NtrC family response regulator
MNNEAIDTKRNVLVVDDDPAIQEMLCEIIQQEGCNAVSVGSGEEALKKVESQHFDLIFLDLVLPGMSGVDTLSVIKEKDDKVVVITITAYGYTIWAKQAMALGSMFLIHKPFQAHDIVEILDTVNFGR